LRRRIVHIGGKSVKIRVWKVRFPKNQGALSEAAIGVLTGAL
jgi:hypothetical protein